MVDRDPIEEFVCGTCGVPIARKADNTVIHIDELPENAPPHEAFPWVTRREFLIRQERRVAATPGERSAAALERIADALERLLDTSGGAAVRSAPDPDRGT